MKTFHCADCGADKPVQTAGGTGYVTTDDGKTICYDCVGKRDRAAMIATGRATMCLIHEAGRLEITNWPGTLRFAVDSIRMFHHPLHEEAKIAYFHGPDGKQWSGRNVGTSQVAHCRRLKGAR